MSNFEFIGVRLQHSARSKEDAVKRFEYSCDRCCMTGKRIDCDRCAIAQKHNAVVEAFDLIAGQNALPVPTTSEPK